MHVTTSKAAGASSGERLRRHAAIVDRRAGLELVQPRNAQRLVAEIDSQRDGAEPGHRLGQDPAAAADVDDALPRKPARHPVDPLEPQRIHLVQRPEHRAFRVPPLVRERRELGELLRVDVFLRRRTPIGWGRAGGGHCRRSCHARARAAIAASSAVVSARPETTRRPATQTSVTASRPTAWTRWETGS